MLNYCSKCKKKFECSFKKCPNCGSRLEKQYTEEELKKMQKESEDITVINNMFFM